MKQFNSLKKIVTFLLVISVSLVMLSGCAKNSGSTAATSKNSTANNKLTTDQMKQKMEENIKSLVTDKTITQTQADQIVTTLTANGQGFGQGKGNGKGKQNGSGSTNDSANNNKNSNNGNTNSSGTTSNAGGNANSNSTTQNGDQRPNPLAKLVSDGVITQAQADTVMQKIYGNSKRSQNNQNTQSTKSVQ